MYKKWSKRESDPFSILFNFDFKGELLIVGSHIV